MTTENENIETTEQENPSSWWDETWTIQHLSTGGSFRVTKEDAEELQKTFPDKYKMFNSEEERQYKEKCMDRTLEEMKYFNERRQYENALVAIDELIKKTFLDRYELCKLKTTKCKAEAIKELTPEKLEDMLVKCYFAFDKIKNYLSTFAQEVDNSVSTNEIALHVEVATSLIEENIHSIFPPEEFQAVKTPEE